MPEARPGGSTGVNDAPGRRTGTLSLLLLIEQVPRARRWSESDRLGARRAFCVAGAMKRRASSVGAGRTGYKVFSQYIGRKKGSRGTLAPVPRHRSALARALVVGTRGLIGSGKMASALPVVVRVKRKRELAPVDTIVVEAEESHAAKRRARDAALAAELDTALSGALGDSVDERQSSIAGGHGSERAPLEGTGRPNRRRFRRVQMTLSVADARDEGRVRELVQTVVAATRVRAREDVARGGESTSLSKVTDGVVDPASHPTKRATRLTRPANARSTSDAMSGHFRMYDLVCDEGEAPPPAKPSPSTRKPVGAGLRRCARPPPPPRDATDESREEDPARLLCNYAPMLREYLGTDALGTNGETGVTEGGDDDDKYVYDVYVRADDDDKEDDEGANAKIVGDVNAKANLASLIYINSEDAALFEWMDGLAEEYHHEDDVDSQDSNREDAPDADYPEDESDSYSEGDSCEDWVGGLDDDGFGSRHRGRYNWVDRGVEGDYSGDDDVYDEFHGGIERHSGYREVAYDPLFDDVGGES